MGWPSALAPRGHRAENVALQGREFDVERLQGFAALDEFVTRGGPEQAQDLFGGWVGTMTLLRIEREVLNAVAAHARSALERGA
jgi:hypothetical protein